LRLQIPVEIRVRLRIALLMLSVPTGCWALSGGIDLTQLPLKELMHVEIALPTSVAGGTDVAKITAIRAGCSDGLDVCEALREVLAGANRAGGDTSRASRDLGSTKPRTSDDSDASQEYNLSTVHREGLAAPSDMGFGRAPTVSGAMRAFGFGPSK